MHTFTTVAATAALAVAANAQEFIAGNWYTNQVDTIQYTNFGSSGTYNQITNMDSTTGSCSSTPFAYSGSMAPLNGEVSVNFRGPFALKQFAFYTPSSAAKAKRDEPVAAPKLRANKRHAGHAKFHEKQAREVDEKRQVGAWVTVTMNGQVVSWQNEWAGTPTDVPQANAGSSWITATIDGQVVSWQANPTSAAAAATATAAAATGGSGYNVVQNGANNAGTSAAAASSAAAAPSAAAQGASGGAYTREAYYDSASQTAQGLTFLNHMGGQGSGVFDYTFGNSLSYASSDATTGAASSQILQDITIPSDNELVIMTDKSCDDGGCGYTRPGTVAYHGFDGANKIFLFEFSMPSDGTTGFNADMPALWLLNAQIPNTIQYGPADCSCWTSGCGEFDIMEVLDSGDFRCKSTMHGGVSGGDSAYIQRPTGSPIKVALVMSDSTATIKVLDDSFDFSSGLSQSQVDDLSSSSSIGGLVASLFNLGS